MSWNLIINEPVERTIFTKMGEQIGVNVVHYTVLAIAGTANSQTVVEQLDGLASIKYLAWLSEDATYLGTKLRSLSPTPPLPSFGALNQANGGGGSALPRQLSGLIRKRADLQGPAGRGRVFIPFPGANMMEGSTLSAGGITKVNDIGVVLMGAPSDIVVGLGGGNTVTLRPVLRSGTPGLFRVIVQVQGSDEWATQRRRGFFGRPNSAPAELS